MDELICIHDQVNSEKENKYLCEIDIFYVAFRTYDVVFIRRSRNSSPHTPTFLAWTKSSVKK